MKVLKSVLVAVSVGATIAGASASPVIAQSHYDTSSRVQCGGWQFQYRALAAASRVFRSLMLANASYNAGAAYGAANCQRF
ncbi:MAG: hypothetical protein ACT6TH_10210 [Brevundimonas sp.]|uniref:hypothetical protein n=1 Tax=Brevundimonas sp. TaxID=1871086 RepID=UPI0040343DF9